MNEISLMYLLKINSINNNMDLLNFDLIHLMSDFLNTINQDFLERTLIYFTLKIGVLFFIQSVSQKCAT